MLLPPNLKDMSFKALCKVLTNVTELEGMAHILKEITVTITPMRDQPTLADLVFDVHVEPPTDAHITMRLIKTRKDVGDIKLMYREDTQLMYPLYHITGERSVALEAC